MSCKNGATRLYAVALRGKPSVSRRVPCDVFRHVDIEQVDRHRETLGSFDFVLPGAEVNRAALLPSC